MIHLVAGENKVLTNGEIYSKSVYVGDADSAENWREVDESEWPGEDVS